MQFDIRRLDIYRKVPKDLTQPTFTGAVISVSSIVFIVYLFVSELTEFLRVEVVSDMFVDEPGRHEERIPMKIDISLPKLNCKYPGLDIQDDLGRHEVGFVDNVERFPLNNGQGCRFKARFNINKKALVAGSFNPLRGRDRSNSTALSSHDYILKVVPSIIQDITGKTVAHPYQYTYAYRAYMEEQYETEASKPSLAIPAIWFVYELSPITVSYSLRDKPWYSFLTTICAIIGGTFTVAGIIDSMLFTATEYYKKLELGKQS